MARARAELAITRTKAFFNTGWSGPSPARVVEEQKRALEWLAAEGVSHHTYKEQSARIQELRGRLALFLRANPDEIALTRSTTEAINIVLSGMDWRPGQKIVTTTVEHGAGLVPLYNLRERFGVSIEMVNLHDGGDMLRKFSRVLDERTALVVVSHVSFSTGLRLPLKALSSLVAERGSQILVDGAQSVGVIPLDLHDIGCDYYSLPGHKWMLGPDTTGALYIRRDRIGRLKLGFAGNESVTKYNNKGKALFHTTARKFEMADYNTALISGWIKALDFIEEFGMAHVESAIRENTAYLKRRLARIKGVRVVTPIPWERSAGLVSIELLGKSPKKAFKELLKKGIITRFTPPPSYLRISVNFFNTREELDRLVEELERLSAP
ncbi:MAG: aminotransferase class V-fold PLP-dependent enzyme [Candidatus Abyssubacteria bacterium]